MPPHEISDKAVAGYLPDGRWSRCRTRLDGALKSGLADHPVNQKRIAAEAKRPPRRFGCGGNGRSMQLDSYQAPLWLGGGIVSAVDLLKGLAKLAGLEAPDVEGATGLIDTNYAGKVAAARYSRARGFCLFAY